MIARIWHGRTTVPQAEAYLEYFRITGLADYQATEGNRGVVVLRKDQDQYTDFLVLTLWESREAIRAFAGEDIDKARYYPEDRQYFSELEPNVTHYEVALNTLEPSQA